MNKETSIHQHQGFVTIAGAGPGDPELVTLKLVRRLSEADIVLMDRLVSPQIVLQHAPQAVVVPVGKQCRRGQSTPQTTINQLLVQHALAGRRVVRLKGGDSSIFSNILDELKSLHAAAIPFEIIPGITAASGVAAVAGVPLTARGLSLGIHFISCYKEGVISHAQWQFYACSNDTLVFYMSGETLALMQQSLLRNGKAAQTPVLLAEQATTPAQRFRLSTLANCVEQWGKEEIISPAMLIVGEVAALHEKFGWDKNDAHALPWFDSPAKAAVPLRQKPPVSASPVVISIP